MSKTETETGPYGGRSAGEYWREQLDHACEVFKDWEGRADKVVERYRDERSLIERAKTPSKFNIFWSNVQVLTPALYGRQAKPEVSRRHDDADPAGRLASMLLERILDYETQQFPDFDSGMSAAVEDRLLGGRGTVWVRYDPVFGEEPSTSTDVEQPPVERIDAAHAPVDYVFWKDFRHSPARTWDEVWWVARRVYMTREEGTKQFGDAFRNVPLNESALDEKDKKKQAPRVKQAKVWEVWNKRTGRVCWVAEGYTPALAEADDPLGLEEFFPCPKPLYATLTNGSLIPVPDYVQYQDQAAELDDLTARIDDLVEAVRVCGVFNAEYKSLARLFQSKGNRLIPVDNWQAFSEKQGLKGAIDVFDLSTVQQALGMLLNAREAVKQTIYEICGISDILRGATEASETLGAQELKAQFGSLRLRKSQKDVARFATEIFRLKAQIICKFYPPELLVKMSGITNIAEAKTPTFQQQLAAAIVMLQDGVIRDFQIAVESDSLAQIDEAEEKAAASEAITAIGGFLREALPMVQQAPETLPMASEFLLFLVRRYRAGRGLEYAIEQTMRLLQQKAEAMAQNPPPSEALMEAQIKAQSEQMRAQVDSQVAQLKAQMDSAVQRSKLEAEMQLEKLKAQLDIQREAAEQRLKMMEAMMEARKDLAIAGIQSDTAIEVAHINADSKIEAAEKRPAPTNGQK